MFRRLIMATFRLYMNQLVSSCTIIYMYVYIYIYIYIYIWATYMGKGGVEVK